MEQGINTIIVETKKELVNAINSAIGKGLPIAVVELMLDSVTSEVKGLVEKALANEKQKAEEEENTKNAQIPYVEGEN